jgi:hypothetical protein
MKQLLINFSNIYALWKRNEPVSNIVCYTKPTTEPDGCINLITQSHPSANDMQTPNKDIGGYNKEIKASINDKQSPKQHTEVSPKQIEVAIQLLACIASLQLSLLLRKVQPYQVKLLKRQCWMP